MDMVFVCRTEHIDATDSELATTTASRGGPLGASLPCFGARRITPSVHDVGISNPTGATTSTDTSTLTSSGSCSARRMNSV